MLSKMRGKAKVRFLLVSLILTVMFLSPQLAPGATAPDVTRLLNINGQTFSGRVASDSVGNVYIADMVNKQVRVYSYSGVQVRTIGLQYAPTALAVSPGNLLYVGENAQNGHCYIEVFSQAGALVRTMDATDPHAMAFLSSGELYLLDGYMVKKLDGSMNQVMSFGGYATFRDPMALTLSEQKGEIYVLDRGGTANEGSYGATAVWRVQVFDLSGAPLRNFSSYGFGADGKIGSASGLAVDKAGRIYISDNVQPIIAVYDENGVYLKTIFDATNPLYNSVNLSYNNDRLYIASLSGNFVAAYAIDAFSTLDAAPNPINITWQPGMANPSRTLTISNSGTAALTWQAAADASSSAWLSTSLASGTVAANATQDIAVTVNAANLPAGQKSVSGTIIVTAPGAEKTVTVNVAVGDAPTLAVSPASITVTRKFNESTAPIPLTITIGNDQSGGALTWHATVSADAAWLGMNPLDGNSLLATAPIVKIADAVQPGSYSGSIVVALDGASGSPVSVPVSLVVESSSSITVNTNNANASFTIAGPGLSDSATGMSYFKDGVAAGSYTVTYGKVDGFKTPAAQTKTIAAGESATFTGNYSDLRKSLDIVVSHGSRKNESNEVAVFKGDGTKVLGFVPSMPLAYGVTTAVGDVDGDGVGDVIVGGMPAVVKAYALSGTTATAISGLEFSAYEKAQGVNLAAADFDGDGRDEIITGDARLSSVVRVFSFGGSAVADTGVYVEPFKDLGQGVNVAAADVDGDGSPELITIQAVSDVIPEVKIYKVNTAAGSGRWTASLSSRFTACSTAGETSLAAADVDADGIADIIVVCRNGKTAEVSEFSGNGSLIAGFTTASANAMSLAAGDTNFDANAEIILGASRVAESRFRIYNSQGSTLNTVPAFTGSYGVRVSVGNLGY